jgi:hypothetical protein
MTRATLPVRAISSSYEKPPGQVRIIVRMLVPAQDLAVGKPAGPTRRKHPPPGTGSDDHIHVISIVTDLSDVGKRSVHGLSCVLAASSAR